MTTTHLPAAHRATMASRIEPPDSLQFFPTPPWATRALMQHALSHIPIGACTVWEPAAGEGHMSCVLAEQFNRVYASDVHDYGALDGVGSFIGQGADVLIPPERFDWIITNPPFGAVEEFAATAIDQAWMGAAMLVPLRFLEGVGRWKFLQEHPNYSVWLFAERVPMHKGRWDPDGDTATAYAWIVWHRAHVGPATFHHIPPGQRKALEHPSDRVRFGAKTDIAA